MKNKILAFLTFLGLALVLSAPGPQVGGFGLGGNPRSKSSSSGASFQFFEFAPADGTGMGAACACTKPSGAKGEVLTFNRASAGTCLKSTSATNIANGDLVTCSVNQARVMPGFDGSGVLGLLMEATATNSVFQSQALGTSPWAGTAGVVAAPTVTNNFAVAPDGTTTATRLQIPATDASGTQYSAVFQAVTIGAGNSLASMFVKGNGSSGVIDLCWNTLVKQCVVCSFTSTAWARCATGVGTTANQIFIGNVTLTGYATGPRSASDVLVWGVQGELNNYATSYIATTSTAVTRAADDATFAFSNTTFTAPWSIAGTAVLPATSPVATNARLHGTVGTAGLGAFAADSFYTTTWTADSSQTTPNSFNTTKTIASTITRAATYHDGTLLNGCIDGVCGAGTAVAFTYLASVNTYKPGQFSTVNGTIDGVQKLVCISNNSASVCR